MKYSKKLLLIDKVLHPDNYIVTKGPLDTKCWISTYWKGTGGYPLIKGRGKKRKFEKISRVILDIVGWEGLQALHHCDTPSCIRPSHIYIGTHYENMQDKLKRGRQLNGEDIFQSKLTGDQVKQIRWFYSNNYHSQIELADFVGVSQ